MKKKMRQIPLLTQKSEAYILLTAATYFEVAVLEK